jgi:hypothetical protein
MERGDELTQPADASLGHPLYGFAVKRGEKIKK